jgi:molecular chaperone DnaK (HSP70)
MSQKAVESIKSLMEANNIRFTPSPKVFKPEISNHANMSDPEDREVPYSNAPENKTYDYDTRGNNDRPHARIERRIEDGEAFIEEIASELKELMEENDTVKEHIGQIMEHENNGRDFVRKANYKTDQGEEEEARELIEKSKRELDNSREAVHVIQQEIERMLERAGKIETNLEKIEHLETEIEAAERKLEG